MAKKDHTEITLAGELEQISNVLWRIKNLASIAAHSAFEEERPLHELAHLMAVIEEMADQCHDRSSDLEMFIRPPQEPRDQPDYSNWEAAKQILSQHKSPIIELVEEVA